MCSPCLHGLSSKIIVWHCFLLFFLQPTDILLHYFIFRFRFQICILWKVVIHEHIYCNNMWSLQYLNFGLHLRNPRKLSASMSDYKHAILQRQAFNHPTPHITLAPVMSPEESCTLHSETVKGNQSSPAFFGRNCSAENLRKCNQLKRCSYMYPK